MNSSMYHQIAKTAVADRLLEAERVRIARAAARPARRHSLSAGWRGAVVARRVRVLARLRTA
jgi:hypothetical protein